jgi:hypothetical protein
VASSRAEGGASASALAEAARQSQLQVRAQLLRDVATAWPSLNFQQLGRTWPGWLRVMSELMTRYHARSAAQAGLFYRASRQFATGDPGVPEIVRLASPPDPVWVERAFGFAAPGTYRKSTVELGRDAEVASRTALTQTLGTASRVALDGGRATLEATGSADPVALGFYRVTDGDPCAFCALVASRGAVYKDEFSAGEVANTQFVGAGMFKYHNHCGCTIAPVFSRDAPVPDLNRRLADRYAEATKGAHGDLLNVWRRAYEGRPAK